MRSARCSRYVEPCRCRILAHTTPSVPESGIAEPAIAPSQEGAGGASASLGAASRSQNRAATRAAHKPARIDRSGATVPLPPAASLTAASRSMDNSSACRMWKAQIRSSPRQAAPSTTCPSGSARNALSRVASNTIRWPPATTRRSGRSSAARSRVFRFSANTGVPFPRPVVAIGTTIAAASDQAKPPDHPVVGRLLFARPEVVVVAWWPLRCHSAPSGTTTSPGMEALNADSPHRRLRLHRLGGRQAPDPVHPSFGREYRSDDLCRIGGRAGGGAGEPATYAGESGRGRPAGDAGGVRPAPAGRGDAPGSRKPRRPLDRRAGGVHPDQRGRHLLAAGSGARLLVRIGRCGEDRVPLPPHLHRRGVRRPGCRRSALHRDDAV